MGCKPFPCGVAPGGARFLTSWRATTACLVAVSCLAIATRVRGEDSTCVAPDPGRDVLSVDELTEQIDAALAAAWAQTNTEPAPAADDAEFLRRVYLDVIGKIPSVTEVEQFLLDTSADKRTQVVDELLRRGAYAQHFANTWRELMLAGTADNAQSQLNSPQFETWLRLRFAIGMPYDRLVRELLTAPIEAQQPRSGRMRSFVPSPAAFFQANEMKREMIAANTTRIFLGVQVQCAECHDHPFSHWTQRDFWSLAAFFDPSPGEMPQRPDEGSLNAIAIPKSGVVVEPAFLDGSQPDWASGDDKRALLARWITQTDNPFFARAAVNRLWDHFLGRGFVHPVDDLDEANPPSHPELFDTLAEQFAAHRFNLGYLIRAITGSRAYRLTSRADNVSEEDLAKFARMPIRRMTADQLFASIVQATGYRQQRRTMRRGQVLPDLASAAAEFRSRFADSSVPRTEAETSILQALALMNGKLVSDATALETSETLVAVADAPFLSHSQRVESLFLATLSRRPEPAELERFTGYVERGGATGDAKQALADVFWALLNSAEFGLNH